MVNLIVDYQDKKGRDFHQCYQAPEGSPLLVAHRVKWSLECAGHVVTSILEVPGRCTFEELQLLTDHPAADAACRPIYLDLGVLMKGGIG